MYMLEITTAAGVAGVKETISLQVNYFDTWGETSEQIDKIKKMDLYNIEINLYKKDPIIYDKYNLIDNFYKIEKNKRLFTFNNKKDNKNKKQNILLLFAGAAAFPIMLLFEVIKKK